MSTKIYNGFKFKTNDIFEINKHIEDFREELKVMEKQKITEFYANTAIHYIDYNTVNDIDMKNNAPFMVAFNEFNSQQREVKKRGIRNPLVDMSFSISVFSYEKEFYGIYYAMQEDFAVLWMDKPFVEDFHYQNSTDKPDKISDEDWKKREKVWEEIFKKESIPSIAGFVYTVIPEDSLVYPTVQDVMRVIPDFETRVDRQIKDLAYMEYTKNRTITATNALKVLRNFKEFYESEKGLEKREELKEFVKNKLKKVITNEIMQGQKS